MAAQPTTPHHQLSEALGLVQLSASARVAGIAELLEMKLLATTRGGIVRCHSFEHLFLWQRVNRYFASTIKDSTLLQKAMFLTHGTPIATQAGMLFEMNPTLCSSEREYLLTSTKHRRSRVTISGRPEGDMICLCARIQNPWCLSVLKPRQPWLKTSRQSWEDMKVANGPCKIKLRIVHMWCFGPCQEDSRDFAADVTFGDIAAAVAKVLEHHERLYSGLGWALGREETGRHITSK